MQSREESLGIISSFKNLINYVFSYFTDLALLAKLEAQLAKKSFLQICLLGLIAFVILLSSWMGICALLVASGIALGLNLIVSLLVTIGINFVILFLIACSIVKLKRNLYFSATLKQLTKR